MMRKLRFEFLESRRLLRANLGLSGVRTVASGGASNVWEQVSYFTSADPDDVGDFVERSVSGAVNMPPQAVNDSAGGSSASAYAELSADAPPPANLGAFGGSASFGHQLATGGDDLYDPYSITDLTYQVYFPTETTFDFSYNVTSSGRSSVDLKIEDLGWGRDIFEQDRVSNQSDQLSVIVGPGRVRISAEVDQHFYAGPGQTTSLDVQLDWTFTPHETDRDLYSADYFHDADNQIFYHIWEAFEYEGPFQIGLLLSQDKLVDAGDIPLDVRTYNGAGSLGTGSEYSENFHYGYGTYANGYDEFHYSVDEAAIEERPYLLYAVDPFNAIQEFVEEDPAWWALRPFVQPIEMTYDNTAADIKPDPGSGVDSFAGPHYVDTNADGDADDDADIQAPVLYVAGDVLKIKSIVFQEAGLMSGEVRIKGEGPDGLDFAPRIATRENGELRVDDWVASQLPMHVFRDREFDIDWSVSTDGGQSWSSAGATQTPLYVAAAAPANVSLFESVVDIAIRNTQGLHAAQRQQIIDMTWADFSDRHVSTVADEPLFYYGDPSEGSQQGDYVATRNRTVPELLEHRTGQCGSVLLQTNVEL